jgi:predicted transposase/invertase (TIGR01784 family)
MKEISHFTKAKKLIMQLPEAYLKKRQEWYEEGLEEGEQRGEQQALRSVAMTMLRENMLPESIARITGLSIAQIEQLRQELATEN